VLNVIDVDDEVSLVYSTPPSYKIHKSPVITLFTSTFGDATGKVIGLGLSPPTEPIIGASGKRL